MHAIARRLFKTAVTVNKYHSASWVAWAKHEQRAGNIGEWERRLVWVIDDTNSRPMKGFFTSLYYDIIVILSFFIILAFYWQPLYHYEYLALTTTFVNLISFSVLFFTPHLTSHTTTHPYLTPPHFTSSHSFFLSIPHYSTPSDVARRLLIAGISNFPHSKNIGWFHAALASLARQDGKSEH